MTIIKTLPVMALASALTLAAPLSFAATSAEVNADVNADVNAINKDDAALAKQQQTLEENRASKAQNKAEGDTVGQAIDSVKIGANHTGIAEKKVEKDADKKILKHHRKQQQKTNTSVDSNTSVDTNTNSTAQ